ncbi:YjjG family noncanonical pyrimidine nucleotidase [Staphylococcus sp. 30400_3112M30941]|nr:YjjG family noncanonical pyrimidine nucleotidase [Staphylococcus sp. 30403_3112M30944]MBO0945938.1 YjjG family noncanonical pyrimidine nucleotidase [Staphylococcus sp. 30402_3112M30943]MBO0963312.1 YjjG family noncanonical pyrimidine nucleotidase [Staphylococcus sp. 30400_3112M30941]MBO0966478.1 YjjG family noncanonical pyrimidine nucleotidase [Staphylococcus sp. 30401_3112M30942]
MGYKNILIDFDDTIVDFYDAEEWAFHYMANLFEHKATDLDFLEFKKINHQHWEAFQQNKLTKAEVLSQRFVNYFKRHQMEIDGHRADVLFRNGLAEAKIKYFDQTLETIIELSENHNLYIVTNGVTETQKRRLNQTSLHKYFKNIYISEETGHQKPSPEFFNYVFNDIGESERESSIIVGDSLTSDILGGINAGIATCWFNFRNFEPNPEITPDYEINSWTQLKRIVDEEN